MANRKCALLVISTEGQFTEFFLLAKHLREKTDIKPLVYFNLGLNETFHEQAAKFFASGIDVVSYGSVELLTFQSEDTNVSPSGAKPALRKKLVNFLKNTLPNHFLSLRKFYYVYIKSEVVGFPFRVFSILKRLKFEAGLLRHFHVGLIVLGEDNQEYFTPYLVKVGHESNVKTVVFPYAYANRFDSLVLAHYLKNYSRKNLLNFAISKFFSKWTLLDRQLGSEIRVLKNTASVILTSELFKVTPNNPWTMSAGFSDAIFVESQHMLDYYIEDGQIPEKMKVTGYPSNDVLNECVQNRSVLKEAIRQKYKIQKNDKPWVVFALPSEQPREINDFTSYDHMLDVLFAELSKVENVQFLFKLHPRTSYERVSKLVQKHDVLVLDEGSYELIGIADIFAASVSSIMRWSLACHIPTINFDMYKYRYADFIGAENYFVVETLTEFLAKIKELSGVSAVRGHHTEEVSAKYPSIDGKAIQRIVGSFQEMLR